MSEEGYKITMVRGLIEELNPPTVGSDDVPYALGLDLTLGVGDDTRQLRVPTPQALEHVLQPSRSMRQGSIFRPLTKATSPRLGLLGLTWNSAKVSHPVKGLKTSKWVSTYSNMSARLRLLRRRWIPPFVVITCVIENDDLG